MEITEKLSESDKEFIRDYVAQAGDDEEKRQRRKECASQFNVSISTIAAITAWTKIWGKETKMVSRPVEAPAPNLSEAKPKLRSEDGSHIDYNNPIKKIWREKWKQFIDKHTNPLDRPKLKVLCLPGKMCLEVPLYLELGFKACNIVGVEGGDDAARSEFLKNANTFGIVPKLGRLEAILKNELSVYDVVSLDFTGPINRKCLDILKALPLAPLPSSTLNTKALFMVNVLGKRETQVDQSFIDFYSSFTRPELQEMIKPGMDIPGFQKVVGYMSELQDKIESGTPIYEDENLKDRRSICLPFVIVSLLSKRRRKNDTIWLNYRMDELSDSEKDGISFKEFGPFIVSSLLDRLACHLGKRGVEALTIGIPQIVEIVTTYSLFVREIEEYQYYSTVNNVKSPFLTEMMVVDTPMSDYLKARHFVKFIVDAVYWMAKHKGKPLFAEVRDKHGKCKFDGKMDRKDTVEFIDENGFVVASIQWQKLLETYNNIIGHISNDMALKFLHENKERKRICLN